MSGIERLEGAGTAATRRAHGSVVLRALLLSVLAATGVPGPQGGDEEPTPGSQKFPDVLFDSRRVTIGFKSDVFRQNDSYGIGGTSIRRLECERSAGSGPWACLELTEGTDYYITGLAVRAGGDEVYVAGLRDDGTCVIERWSYRPRKGGWFVEVPTPAEPTLGVPLPPTVPVLGVEGGGPWQPMPSTVAQLPPASRRGIYSTPHGPIHGMDVDPEGRYLLFYDMGLEALVQLDLTQSPPASAVLSGVSLDQVGSLKLLGFPGEGRMCLIRREYPSTFRAADEVYTLLADPENDGVFEPGPVLDSAAWNASVYSNWSTWDLYWQP